MGSSVGTFVPGIALLGYSPAMPLARGRGLPVFLAAQEWDYYEEAAFLMRLSMNEFSVCLRT